MQDQYSAHDYSLRPHFRSRKIIVSGTTFFERGVRPLATVSTASYWLIPPLTYMHPPRAGPRSKSASLDEGHIVA
jgi:hypothetical protein